MTIHCNVTGSERKRLARILGTITSCAPVYCYAPTFAFNIGDYIVDRNGSIVCPTSVTKDDAAQLMLELRNEGFAPELEDEDSTPGGARLTVELPRYLYSPETVSRLEQIIAGKEALFKRAFKAESLTVRKSDDKLSFPWFTLEGVDGETMAYTEFISALGKMASRQKRVTTKAYRGSNDKFTMRLFLVRLGMIGPKYKLTRKILLMNLTGNSAWKNGKAPEREE